MPASKFQHWSQRKNQTQDHHHGFRLCYASQPQIQPFHQTFVFVEGSFESQDDTATTTGKTFSIYEISDLKNIQCREIFRVDDLSALSDKNKKPASLSEVKLDWESEMWSRNSNESTTKNDENSPAEPGRRMRALCHVGYLTAAHCTCNEEAIITNWNLKEDMFIQHYTRTSNNVAMGFVNGRALFMQSSGTYTLPQIEKRQNDCMPPLLTLETVGISVSSSSSGKDRCKNAFLVLPCSNIATNNTENYSFSGIYFGDSIYRYSLKQNEFVTSHPIPLLDETLSKNFSFSEGHFGRYPKFVPFMENDQRLRSFMLQEGKLYEFLWSDSECTSLKVVQHLEWWNDDFESVTRIGNVGLLLRTHEGAVFYIPQALGNNEPFSKAKGKIGIINNQFSELFWCEQSQCVAQFNNETKRLFEKVLSLQDLMGLEFKLVSDLFNEETYLKDLEFSCYDPRLQDSKSLEIVDPSTLSREKQRVSIAYQCVENGYNDMEIIAGIGCKEFKDKLGDAISDSYVELEPEDFASYLGAPIMHTTSWFPDRLEYRYFILDMKDGRKSSGIINIASITRGCSSSTSINLKDLVEERNKMRDEVDGAETSKTHSRKSSFIGILSPKSSNQSRSKEETASSLVSQSLSQKKPKIFEKLALEQLFQVESTQIRVCDPFSERGGVIIENVKPGLWKWVQYGCDSKIFDGRGNVAQLLAFHGDYKYLLQDPKIWIVPEGTYQPNDRSRKIEKNEFHEKELEGGWYVMKLGVGVDVAMAGIYDQKYFNDASVLELEKKQNRSAIDLNFKFSFFSEWQEYVNKVMEQRNYPNSIPVPYGIISSSGYGDGCYACLFKKSEDQVVAVKLVFVNETN
ncbi:hypothetical protein FDP41_000911 [Naegleria fowleri]|uniref:DUF4241 domain-containing protein n=1 Tax=Naegleria fowleri TaxID=5763 RepID=A0A6A5C1J3_NAEFO|nr:uncharacterized protein FDP41_000911 [Naegleria fowleri]KAF0979758.1 hypothetical protein FDP41_000911 [Naegleria fowleri]